MADFDKYIRQGEPDRHIDRRGITINNLKQIAQEGEWGKSGKWAVKKMNLSRQIL